MALESFVWTTIKLVVTENEGYRSSVMFRQFVVWKTLFIILNLQINWTNDLPRVWPDVKTKAETLCLSVVICLYKKANTDTAPSGEKRTGGMQ